MNQAELCKKCRYKRACVKDYPDDLRYSGCGEYITHSPYVTDHPSLPWRLLRAALLLAAVALAMACIWMAPLPMLLIYACILTVWIFL